MISTKRYLGKLVPTTRRSRTRGAVAVAALAALAFAALPAPAAAYIGPGAALSLLGAFWGVLVAIGAAVAFAVAWPVRRYLRMRRQRKAAPDAPVAPASEIAAPAAAPTSASAAGTPRGGAGATATPYPASRA